MVSSVSDRFGLISGAVYVKIFVLKSGTFRWYSLGTEFVLTC